MHVNTAHEFVVKHDAGWTVDHNIDPLPSLFRSALHLVTSNWIALRTQNGNGFIRCFVSPNCTNHITTLRKF